MTTTFHVASPRPRVSKFKPGLEMNHALSDSDLQGLTGGMRTTQEDCEEADMEWSSDKNTVYDGLGKCSLPPWGWSYM
jgi:hypothetical protein